MNIVIIEDEKLTAEDLADVLLKLEPKATIVKILASVKESIAYFKSAKSPDLIFSDIQLGDGLSFDIFKSINTTAPVIFCTAYDEYALNAFKTNGIDYVLKPFTVNSIALALNKYYTLRLKFAEQPISYGSIFETYNQKASQRISSILVNYQDKIIPIRTDQIALFYIKNDLSQLLTFDHKNYLVSKNLEELEKITDENFFRVSRQYLINRSAIKDAAHFFSRKLIVNLSIAFKEPITVSKEKTPQFLDWLSET